MVEVGRVRVCQTEGKSRVYQYTQTELTQIENIGYHSDYRLH